MNCLPFLGHEKWEAFLYTCRAEGETRRRGRGGGVIRRFSWLPKLQRPILVFHYSRLLTRANAIVEGLNPARSFNLVSSARNWLSGNPNCELFPQGPIIPVPPSTPPYRPARAYGNNWAVFPGRHAKREPPNQRVRRPLFPLFRWWLCSVAMPKQHQAVLGSIKTRVQKPVPVIPTLSSPFAVATFQLGLVWLSICPPCRRIPPRVLA